jgi:outer membrane protein TolC
MVWQKTRPRQYWGILSKLVAASFGFVPAAALVSAQDLGTTASRTTPSLTFSVSEYDADAAAREWQLASLNVARRITLEEAQQIAGQATNIAARLGQLGVDAAREHRLAAAADYFPKTGLTFSNLHFNKFMGEQITIVRPLLGVTNVVGVPLVGQDQTLLAVNVIQPVTPLLKVRQAVKLARADENIARAKAGLPVTELARTLEKNYFDLLIAQKQLELAEARVRSARAGRLVSGITPVALNLEHSEAETTAVNEWREYADQVKALTASLNERLGWPIDTQLALEAPAPLVERISLQQAVDAALSANPTVIEAEQTVHKAQAGVKLAKLDYIPDIAVFGGYAHQSDVVPLLPDDFSYIGILGSYNIFDFGKREHSKRERSAQMKMAETALELTKLKVASAVRTSYLELERSRTRSEVARRETATHVLASRRDTGDVDITTSQLRNSLEMLQLEYRHRHAYGELIAMMGQQ